MSEAICWLTAKGMKETPGGFLQQKFGAQSGYMPEYRLARWKSADCSLLLYWYGPVAGWGSFISPPVAGWGSFISPDVSIFNSKQEAQAMLFHLIFSEP
jgi:hypothetical protein